MALTIPTSKIHVVFDCSAKYRGMLLNDQLLKAPDLTNSLFGVLSRFRQERIALMADIEVMFYQVRVIDADSTYLRFLWWRDGDVHPGHSLLRWPSWWQYQHSGKRERKHFLISYLCY